MKRLVSLLLVLLLMTWLFPPATSGRVGDPGEGGVDPCEACIYVPAWCGLCLIELWWNDDGDCFPWWPECY
ncbi:MAG: hypothetical protein GF330_02370 [Candidatus Eisenbacteria bacterium]|nr:hypothetical protein [Candidatus Eisenbacteria bacterium]